MKKQSDHSLATKKQNIIYTYIFFYLWMHFCFCVSVASKKGKQIIHNCNISFLY